MFAMFAKLAFKPIQLARNCATFGTQIRHFCQTFVSFSGPISGDTLNGSKRFQLDFSFEVPKMQILP